MRRSWAVACAAAVLLTAGVGLQQSHAIEQFRNPPVTAVLGVGERREADGVAYALTSFRHAAALPAIDDASDRRPDGLVHAMPGAELILVVLTVERVDPSRDPAAVFCEIRLADDRGRRWTTESSALEYDVARPKAVVCGGDSDHRPRLNQPYEVGFVFQVPADVVPSVTVRAQLSGGAATHEWEFRPR